MTQPRKIRFGQRDMEFPGPQMHQLQDSNDLLGNMPALHDRMARDGFLFFLCLPKIGF